MSCAGVCRGLLLFSLLLSGIRGTEQKTLDQNTLVPAIKFLKHNYQPRANVQYAIAFNAPADKCADYLDNNFLESHPAKTVKDAIDGKERLYTASGLIAAKPKPQKKPKFHSEYLLLMLPSKQQSPMQKLLNEDETGCAVFYTYNSPCSQFCTNPQSDKCILDALKMFEGHNGPKAFVFAQKYNKDCSEDLSNSLKAVMELVPLYRCDDNNCVACKASNLDDCMN